jgi:hypothetical protein
MFRSFCPSGIISMQYADDTLLFWRVRWKMFKT